MDSNREFGDARFAGVCVYCGAAGDTKDHVPSKVLLDEPYPEALPVVPACIGCNIGFSLDEQYVACLIECVISGSVDPALVGRPKIGRILAENPAIGARISTRRSSVGTEVAWRPDNDRVRKIVLKLARGHAAFEQSEPRLEIPTHLSFRPLVSMSRQETECYLVPQAGRAAWPEIGSRAFVRTVTAHTPAQWLTVQPGRYRYLVRDEPEGLAVQFILSEYLACRAVWK